jgi:adenosine deaminase
MWSMLTRDLLARLPKAELHNHLDGSLRPETLIELAREAGVPLPSSDPEVVRRHMLVDNARDLEEYILRFETTIAVLQNTEAIERVAYEMVEDAARDNVRYIEVRYCPHLSRRKGLGLEAILEAELKGLKQGEKEFGVKTGVINCALRHLDPSVSNEIAHASVDFRDDGVVALDLAGGESGRPCTPHGPAFDIALKGRLGITVHAGEAAGSESIADAIDRCHAHRIGHGTRLYEDPLLRDYMRDRRIPIEINISSNVQTRAVKSAAEHPVRAYYDQGLNVTLSTDSWLISGTSLTDEYWLAHTALGFTRAEIDRMILNGFEAAFLPWPAKQELLKSVRADLARLQ